MYPLIEEVIFADEEDMDSLYSFLTSGATSVKQKLMSYARSQLPGGKYWEVGPEVKKVLQSIKPNNDVCESVLGLNDYLSIALPNIHQMQNLI